MQTTAYLSRLKEEDIPLVEQIEGITKLAFWGYENYRKLLMEFPVYFGFKAVVAADSMPDCLVGFFLARAIHENLEILKVGVYPEFQRKGIGTLLMESAYTEGIKRGCNRCFLEVRKSNSAAINFYQFQHFRITGARLNYYSDPVEDAWIMERAL